MLLLALDTATPAVTVAVHDGSRVLAEHTAGGTPGRSLGEGARRHGELLAPMIAAVLDRAGHVPRDLTGVAVGVGPGPFTGLRVGLVTARVLGETLGVPVHGVCTLDVLARLARDAGTAPAGGPFLATTDARRREVYWARYDAAGVRVDGPAVDRPSDIADGLRALPAVGAGASLYPDFFPDARLPEHPAASTLADLAAERLAVPDGPGLLPAEPLYLRRPDAVPPRERKAVTSARPR